MRNLVSGLTAALTALLLGTLIAGAADGARAADSAKAQRDAAILADTPLEEPTLDAAAYRAQLQQAMVRLGAAYAELAARDAAYRELLATSQGNVDRLQVANRQLQQQVAEASVRLREVEQLQARVAAPQRRDDDDD